MLGNTASGLKRSATHWRAALPRARRCAVLSCCQAAIAAANGLTTEEALATITSDAATILGVADRVGSLRPGLDGDVAIFDGDPFEYATHCTAVVIDGRVVSEEPR